MPRANSRGYRFYSAAAKAEYVREYQAGGGKNPTQFAREKGLSPQTFGNWLRRQKGLPKDKTSCGRQRKTIPLIPESSVRPLAVPPAHSRLLRLKLELGSVFFLEYRQEL
jgi:transposase-like protein